MMASSPLGEIQDLTLCSYCKLPFNETDQLPKVLVCKHHFCLKCVNNVLLKGRELYCVYCWKRTELPDMRVDALPTHSPILALLRRIGSGGLLTPHTKPPDKHKSENCHTHGMPYTLWCHMCNVQICRACASAVEHNAHIVKPHTEARQILRSDIQNEIGHMQKMLSDIQQLIFKQRDFLLKILEACTTLKTQVETDLVNNMPSYELTEVRECLNTARQNYNNTEVQTPAEIYSFLMSLNSEKEKLQSKHQEMHLQCKLDDLIRNAGVIFDFELLKQALANVHNSDVNMHTNNGYYNPILFLTNYCMSQLYSRHLLMKQNQNNNQYTTAQNGGSECSTLNHITQPQLSYMPLIIPNNIKTTHGFDIKNTFEPNNIQPNLSISKPSPININDGQLNSPIMAKNLMPFQTEALNMALPNLLPPGAPILQQANLTSPQSQLIQSNILQPTAIIQHSPQPLMRNPSSHIYPLFYFNIEINGTPFGRILIEVRNDVAPKMTKNFSLLTTGELGIGYKGCNIFQCWENESIITGDFELNNGRGGRSIFEDSYFMPDDTKIMAVRGSVGMRRSQKRHDNLGLVGSQFRIILREMRGFTGIFGYVVEGIELIDRISQSGDSTGKPQTNILIANCGKFN